MTHQCPACAANEIESGSPRTTYACGSSDYDQRPGTFVGKCAPSHPAEPPVAETEADADDVDWYLTRLLRHRVDQATSDVVRALVREAISVTHEAGTVEGTREATLGTIRYCLAALTPSKVEPAAEPEDDDEERDPLTGQLVSARVGGSPAAEPAEGRWSGVTVLPDGSACATASLSLPRDHWLYESADYPPMPFQRGTDDPTRRDWERGIRHAAQYALRASTMSGRELDFDPDAVVQNLIVGMLGYHTPSGASELTPPAPDGSKGEGG